MTKTFSAKLDEPNQAAQITPWDLSFRQISTGPGRTDLTVRCGQFLTALYIKMQSKVHQVGEAPSGLITFGLPAPGALNNWLGVEAPQYSLISFGSGQEFDGVSAAGFKAFTLSFSREHLNKLAADFGLDIADDAFRPGMFNLNEDRRAAQLLARKSAEFVKLGELHLVREAEDEIGLALLLSTTASNSPYCSQSQRLRDRALRRAMDLIEAHTDCPPRIRDLCKASGASWPTLHRAFLDRFGIGPKAYLSDLRLNRARSDLLEAGRQTKVTDIANRLGFWHMGQFAKDYRKLFNCLPSEDLVLRKKF